MCNQFLFSFDNLYFGRFMMASKVRLQYVCELHHLKQCSCLWGNIFSDEEVEDEEMEYLDGGGTLTAAQTRRLAESWQRRYSTDHLDDEDEDEGGSGHESESDLDSDNYSEEYGAEGRLTEPEYTVPIFVLDWYMNS